MSGMLHYSEISDVVWYKKPLAFFGTVKLRGRTQNIRLDQSDEGVTMIVPKLWAFKFKWAIFGGGLRRI